MCQQDQLAFWTKLLHLDGFQVVHEELTAPDEPRRFTVIPKTPVGLCPHCGQLCEDIHRRTESDRVHDLPLGERAVQLTVRTYPVLVRWVRPCLYAADPVPGSREPCHRTLSGTGSAIDCLRRHCQRRSLPEGVGE